MNYKIRCLVAIAFMLCFVSNMQSAHQFSHLQKECLQHLVVEDNENIELVKQVFHEARLLLHKKSTFHAYINSNKMTSFLEHFFVDDMMCRAQYIILIQLYSVFCMQQIQKLEVLLQNIAGIKNYWEQQLAFASLAWYQKNPFHLFYAQSSQQFIQKQIQKISTVEYDLLHVLGTLLYTKNYLHTIEEVEDLCPKVHDGLQPLYHMFHRQVNVNSKELLLYLLYIEEQMTTSHITSSDKLQTYTDSLYKYERQIKCALGSCVALAAIATYAQYKDSIHEYAQATKQGSRYFFTEYVIHPLFQLKDILFNGKARELKKPDFKRFDEQIKIPHLDISKSKELLQTIEESFTDDPSTSLFIQRTIRDAVKGLDATGISSLVYKDIAMQNEELKGKSSEEIQKIFLQKPEKYLVGFIRAGLTVALQEKIQLTETVNGMLQDVEEQLRVGMSDLNNIKTLAEDGVDFANEQVLKPQALNMCVAGIGPLFASLYALYYTSANYLKDKSYFAPMKQIVRNLSRELNMVATASDHIFTVDGKVYLLTVQLQRYMACLDDEQLLCCYQDLQDLNSLALNYEQKTRVVERMYKTYPFL